MEDDQKKSYPEHGQVGFHGEGQIGESMFVTIPTNTLGERFIPKKMVLLGARPLAAHLGERDLPLPTKDGKPCEYLAETHGNGLDWPTLEKDDKITLDILIVENDRVPRGHFHGVLFGALPDRQ